MSTKSNTLPWLLGAIFLLAMIMGAGPGTMLANRPAAWFGLPQLYVWGVFWCFVEIAVVIVAYVYVWKIPDDEEDAS